MKCPSCGAATEGGRFCSNCGTALGKPECPGCGHKPPAGARYCNQCGVAMGGSAMSGSILPGAQGNQVVWWTAGALVLGLIVVIAYPLYGPESAATSPPVAAGPAAGPASRPAGVPPDLSSMTMIEAADDLFDRVMTAVSVNDSEEVVNFLPMALRAYELAEPLDTDGQFHLVYFRRRRAEGQDRRFISGFMAFRQDVAEFEHERLRQFLGRVFAISAFRF